jgi:uncharacterized membrane protein YdbT with pleckstrin-like domain
VFIVILVLSVLRKSRIFEHTFYEIKDNEVEERFNWMANGKHRVRYSEIREVMFMQGVFQRKHGIGSVYIVTNTGVGGLVIDDIREFEEVYEFIEEKIKKHAKKRKPKTDLQNTIIPLKAVMHDD